MKLKNYGTNLSSNNSINIVSTTILAKFGCQTVVVSLILVSYVFILNFAILPWIQTTEYSGRVHGMLSSLLTIILVTNYYLASTTDPGSYKDTLSPSYYLNPTLSIEETEKRFCNKCHEQKIERTHHCRYCNRCVLKMDHHRQWIQNCVGLMNQKYFVLFLFYGSIAIIYFFTLLIYRSVEIIETHASEQSLPELDILQLLMLGFLIVALVIAEITLLSILTNQLWLISKNLTTIEWEDTKRKGVTIAYYKKYDKSLVQNFSQIFGDPSLLWLLPTVPSHLKFNTKKSHDTFIV